MFTFFVGVGIVQVWQSFFRNAEFESISRKLESTDKIGRNIQTLPPTVQKKVALPKKRKGKIDFCEEIKRNPNYPNAEPSNFQLDISGGILNQKVCHPIPSQEFTLSSKNWNIKSVTVQITVDENGFVISASPVSTFEFGQRAAEFAKTLRIRPLVEGGTHLKCIGVLILFPTKNYSKS
jgi:hypothetical protein